SDLCRRRHSQSCIPGPVPARLVRHDPINLRDESALTTWLWGDVLRAARQLPAGPDEVAGVPVGVELEAIAVLRIGFPVGPARGDFGDHRPRPQAGRVDVGDGVLGDLLLLVAEVEDR